MESHLDRLKKQVSKSRCTVRTIKDDQRKQFRDRLKQMRQNNLYNLRNLDISNLQQSIDGSQLTPAEIMELLEEVEQEYNKQVDQYVNDTNLILDGLMMGITFCPGCDKLLQVDTLNMCKQCIDSFNN